MLKTIAHDSSCHRKEALDLAAQYAILQTMLGWKFLKREESISHAQSALGLCKESGNILLLMSAYSKLNYTYITAKNYAKALETMQEGEYVLKSYKKGPSLPRGIIGNFYSGYAHAQVYNGINADMALGIATDSEPLKGRIALTEFAAPDQWREVAWAYCTKGDPKQAMTWLKKLINPETLVSCQDAQSEYEKIETLNILTGTLLQSPERDMGHIIRAWTKTMEWTQALKREVMYDEAMLNFVRMQVLWPSEQAIKKLVPLTSHW
jgi:tetratricopeptide (TPR) repeat protein